MTVSPVRTTPLSSRRSTASTRASRDEITPSRSATAASRDAHEGVRRPGAGHFEGQAALRVLPLKLCNGRPEGCRRGALDEERRLEEQTLVAGLRRAGVVLRHLGGERGEAR